MALAALVIGIVVLAQGLLGGWFLFWPLLLEAAGSACWWQADEAQRERWIDPSDGSTSCEPSSVAAAPPPGRGWRAVSACS